MPSLTATYWEAIVESERCGGKARRLWRGFGRTTPVDLTEQFARGFGRESLWRMRGLYQACPDKKILATPLRESETSPSLSEIDLSPRKHPTSRPCLAGPGLKAALPTRPTFPSDFAMLSSAFEDGAETPPFQGRLPIVLSVLGSMELVEGMGVTGNCLGLDGTIWAHFASSVYAICTSTQCLGAFRSSGPRGFPLGTRW